MPLPELFFFVLALVVFGGLAGLIAGLFGVGGGVIVVPLLFIIFKAAGIAPDIAIHTAIGTSLLTIVLTSTASLRMHSKHGAVDKTILKEWGGAIVIGSILGGLIANQLSGSALSLIFGFFVAGIAGFMVLVPSHSHGGGRSARPPKGFARKCLAFLIGLVSALVGVGGGSLTVPTLVMYRMSIHRAIGTASAIGFLISLPASIVFMLSQTAAQSVSLTLAPGNGAPIGNFGNVNLLAFALLAPATMLTAPIGAKLAHRLPAVHLRKIFALFLGLIALKMIISALN